MEIEAGKCYLALMKHYKDKDLYAFLDMEDGLRAFSAFIEHPLNNIKLIEINILFMVFSFGRYIMTK